MPRTYEQALLNFGFFAGLSEEEAERLAAFARLRNVLTRECLDAIYDGVKKFIAAAPPLYQKVLDFLVRY